MSGFPNVFTPQPKPSLKLDMSGAGGTGSGLFGAKTNTPLGGNLFSSPTPKQGSLNLGGMNTPVGLSGTTRPSATGLFGGNVGMATNLGGGMGGQTSLGGLAQGGLVGGSGQTGFPGGLGRTGLVGGVSQTGLGGGLGQTGLGGGFAQTGLGRGIGQTGFGSQSSLGGGFAQTGLGGGFAQTGLAGGFAQTGLAGGLGQTGLGGGLAQTGLAGGLGQTGLAGGLGQTGLAGGFAQTGLAGGFAQTGLAGGFAQTGSAGGLAQTGLGGGLAQTGLGGGLGAQSMGLFGAKSQTASGGMFAGSNPLGVGGLFSGPGSQTGLGKGSGMLGGGLGLLGGNKPLTQTQIQEDQLQLTAMALSSPTIFGDERDVVITKFNQLQVYWGYGKGICNSAGNTVDFTDSNPFFVMKSVGYVKLPTTEDRDGLVRIIVNKTEDELRTQKTSISNTLRQIINSANITPVIDSAHAIAETRLSEIRFYLLEPSKNRIPTSQVIAFFSTNDMTQKLRNMGVLEIQPCIRPSETSIKAYLERTPNGLDSNVWLQAVKNNPNPTILIPVPLMGFQALKARALAQKAQTEQHESRLKLISNDLSSLQQNQTNVISKYEQAKRKQFELNHRLLKIMVQQEVLRKQGHSIQEDEENLRVQFEAITNELTSPTGVKSKLTEMTSQLRLLLPNMQLKESNYRLEDDVMLGIQMHLGDQQEGIENLLKVITEDMEDLKVIQEALTDGSL